MSASRLPGARVLSATSALVLALSSVGCGEPEPYARAFEITRLDQTIGGPKSLARPAEPGIDRPGDLILENDRIRIGILSAHTSMGASVQGGSIVDADV